MDILKSFSLYDTEYPINIQGTVENPLFQSSQIAKLLGMKSINKQIMNFDSSLKGITESNTLGGVQKTSFLTEKGLYRIICRSNKPIAEKFQNWVCDIIKEIRLTGEYKLKEQLEKSEQHWEINKKLIIHQAKLDIHAKLLELYHLKNVVYICKLKDNEAGKNIIKIGSTQNIKERINNIANNYGCIPLLLDIHESTNHTKFENWIRTNPSIKQLYFEIQKKNGATTRETFLVNDDEYNIIIKLIKNEIKNFNLTPPETPIEKLIELEDKKKINFDLEYKNAEKKLEVLCKIEETKQQIEETPSSDENVLNSNNVHFLKNRQHTRSPKVYQVDPETLEVIHIYDSIIDVIRKFSNSSPSALKEAAKKNTIYKYYRWLLVDRTITNVSEIVIPPTIKSISQNIEYIAMIDIQQTKIMDVFSSQKDAALARKLAGYSTISRAIKQNSLSSGHYWKLFNNCSDEMRDIYLSKNKLPEKFTKSSSIIVLQIDPISNKEIMAYNTITDVLLKYQMSRITLKKCSDNNEIYKCYKWKIVR
jgi:prophage antirepressor-like protein